MVGAPRGYFSQAFLDGLKLHIQENTTLLIQQKDTITDEKIEERLYFDTGIFLVVMILIGAYLLIHNVLQISLSRDIRQYGLLKVLGTTGVQLRKVVYRQIWKMIMIGSLIGSVTGSVLMVTVVPKLLSGMYLNGLGEASSMIAFKPWLLIAAVLFSMAVTFFSASTAMRKIVNMTPVEAAKFSEADAGKQKKIRQSTTGGSLAQITFYSCVIAGLLITVGSFCLAGIAYVMKQRIAYFHFSYPFWSLFLCIVVLFVSCTGIPLFMYHKNQKLNKYQEMIR